MMVIRERFQKTKWKFKMGFALNFLVLGGGGVQRLMANAILNFQFFWNIPLCCHITDNVLNVYSFGLMLQSTSSCSNYLNRIHRLIQARLFDEFS